jgi:hypothetical protein
MSRQRLFRTIAALALHGAAGTGLNPVPGFVLEGQPRPAARGATVDGLQVALAASVDDRTRAVTLDVSFRNAGANDFVLNLGYMLANGKVMFPDALRVNLERVSGTTCELSYHDRRYSLIRGRVDDFIVALPAGAVYTLRLTGDRLWCPGTIQFQTKLEPGDYRVTARFKGLGAKETNLDSPGVALFNFWKGRAESAETSFEVR